MDNSSPFQRFARAIATTTGRPAVFIGAGVVVLVWALSGPVFHFSDTWQLVINTSTTIVTFLMVFLIQNTQNRDTDAIQLKLDELIRVTQGAHLALLDLEKLTDREIALIRKDYESLAHDARRDLARGRSDTGTPEVGHQGARMRRGRRRS